MNGVLYEFITAEIRFADGRYEQVLDGKCYEFDRSYIIRTREEGRMIPKANVQQIYMRLKSDHTEGDF